MLSKTSIRDGREYTIFLRLYFFLLVSQGSYTYKEASLLITKSEREKERKRVSELTRALGESNIYLDCEVWGE